MPRLVLQYLRRVRPRGLCVLAPMCSFSALIHDFRILVESCSRLVTLEFPEDKPVAPLSYVSARKGVSEPGFTVPSTVEVRLIVHRTAGWVKKVSIPGGHDYIGAV